jgi:hypothetical protein
MTQEAWTGASSSEQAEEENMTMKAPAARHLADSIVYLCALLADRPRLIDRYIDYFGETPRCARHGDTGSHASAHLTQLSRWLATAERGSGP